ncbi:MAG: tRNA (guanosine(37)-N1)-methyltransferase TrmD, partial [Lachnospiraceae bacterium]|nr:tRNA (guanosine(37)-N1)-methyltransferase TrmD [Lachnospiraceae bacterium]
MDFYCMTLFPEMIESCMHESITGRAMEKGLLNLTTLNIRDFTLDKHRKVDDYPYGGGAGMVMQAQPVYDAYLSVEKALGKKPRVIYVTPQGADFNQAMA